MRFNFQNENVEINTRLLKVGSLHAKLMGKQSAAKTPVTASSVQQPWASLSGVRVMSWSRNWPNCITIRVACTFGYNHQLIIHK